MDDHYFAQKPVDESLFDDLDAQHTDGAVDPLAKLDAADPVRKAEGGKKT